MMVLNQKGDKIYNTDFLQEIICYKDYLFDDEKIPVIRITAKNKDGRVLLGEYEDHESGYIAMRDLMEAIVGNKNGFVMPQEEY